jgi:hypothetical protein
MRSEFRWSPWALGLVKRWFLYRRKKGDSRLTAFRKAWAFR